MYSMVEDVCKEIDENWKKSNYSCYEFANIVMRVIDGIEFHEAFSLRDVVRRLDVPVIGNIQIPSEFSNLHLKLFDNSRFYVEILNWFDYDTYVHDHNFSGVLIQLDGASVNTCYSFSEARSYGHDLRMGEIQISDMHLWKPGSKRVIPIGRTEKHAVFHLGKPTSSLIIRTHPVDELSPQLNYFPPYVQANHSVLNTVFFKKINAIKLIELTEKRGGTSRLQIDEIVKTFSLSELFWALIKIPTIFFSRQYIDVVEEVLKYYGGTCEDLKKLIEAAHSGYMSKALVSEVKPKLQNEMDMLCASILASSYSSEDVGRAVDILLPSEKDEFVSRSRKIIDSYMIENKMMQVHYSKFVDGFLESSKGHCVEYSEVS
ncbi:MAG: hypothetical protein ACI9CO_000013 [Candidatus Azotimanducaceae bacterium]|jgi:hypothetical protein